jgi:FecR protein
MAVLCCCGVAVPTAVSSAGSTITQIWPLSGTTSPASSASFTDQLSTTGQSGTVTFVTQTSVPGIQVASGGQITVSSELDPGNYTVSGTDSDSSGDAGTWSYALNVISGPPCTSACPLTITSCGTNICETTDGGCGLTFADDAYHFCGTEVFVDTGGSLQIYEIVLDADGIEDPDAYDFGVPELPSTLPAGSTVWKALFDFTGQLFFPLGIAPESEVVLYSNAVVLGPTGPTPSVNVTDTASTTPPGGTLTFTATVAGSDGVTPTGALTWSMTDPKGNPVSCGSTTGPSGSGSTATYTCSVSGVQAGNYTATANYSGDSNYASASSQPDVATIADPVGKVTELTGSATITHSDGSVTNAVVGSWIYLGDTIQTSAAGGIVVNFVDNSQLTLSQNTVLKVDQYVYDPTTGQGSSFYSYLQGAFMYVSGLIGKNNPGQENVDTPVGSIGIRGTEFITQVSPDQSSVQVALGEGEVAITPTSSDVTTTMDAPESATFDSSSVTGPSPLTESAFETLEAQLFPAAPPFEVSPISLPAATPSTAYGPVTLQAVNLGASAAPYTTTLKWKKVSLPKGLKLSSAGLLSGTPNKKLAAGSSSVTVQVTETVTTLNGKKKVKTKTTSQATIPLTIT